MAVFRRAFDEPSLEFEQSGSAQFLSPLPFWNAFAGTIVSSHRSGACTECRILTDTGAMVRGVLAPSGHSRPGPLEGQRVLGIVSAEDVVLARPGYWEIHEQWNQCPGRIVLVEPWNGTYIITIKILGQRWTVKSVGCVIGQDGPPRTWDSVSITIDPNRISVKLHLPERSHLRPRLLYVTR